MMSADIPPVTPDPEGLANCLAAQPWHTLRALAQVNDCAFHGSWNKAAAVSALTTALGEPQRVVEACAALDAEARAALRALLETDGQMLLATFTERFGLIPPYRPWQPDAPVAPWEAPVSPAAKLFYRALVFPCKLGPHRRPLAMIILPREYRAPLAKLLDLPAGQPGAAPLAQPAVADSWRVGLATLLSFLYRTDVTPLHGRWLPPRALRALAAHWPPALPAPEPLLRSELAWPALTFFHYLAEGAGLLALTNGCLRPTTEALDWLDGSPQAQIQHLWSVWRNPLAENIARWQRFRLPLAEAPAPPSRLEAFFQALAACPPQGESPETYLAALAAHTPALFRPTSAYRLWSTTDPAAQTAYHQQQHAAYETLLTGPLTWLGLIECPAASGLRLTPLGAALLEMPGGAWPAPPPPLGLSPITSEADSFSWHWTLTPENTPQVTPRLQLLLEALAPPVPAAPDTCRLTAVAIKRALQRGHTVSGLLALLEQAAGPLPPHLVAACHRWAEELEELTIRRVVILETRDPELLQALTSQRRLRETLNETFSARAIRVNAERLPALLRRLERRGLVPQLDLPPEIPAPPAGLSPAEQVEIAAALRVYAQLAENLGTPLKPPHTLNRTWQAQLTPSQRDAAEQRAETLFRALQQAAPPPTEDWLPIPTGPILALLEQAIADQGTLSFTYYTAGRAAISHRQVDPLRLEWHGDIAYLIGYCRLRRDQRVFRVDRMQEVVREA